MNKMKACDGERKREKGREKRVISKICIVGKGESERRRGKALNDERKTERWRTNDDPDKRQSGGERSSSSIYGRLSR